ncbi:hypothetical protein NUW54_g13952 [Trametes sanguinea]|uniref:Uncharacterized protein n=1 Tax=Trametes sanguinea TaxID=158606 RepID=A0ACC1MG16_9APHY|nr:hypothetical protein NUW54_g13952 [Trametes sanguinea]
MQLASSGVRALKGAQGHFFPSGGGANAATRAIHIPAYVPRPSPSQASSTAHKVIKQTRTILSRFVAHLTAPGVLRAPGDVAAGGPRSFHSPATRMPSIHDRMSYSARTFLAGGPTPFLPRAPVVPRSVTQVGLGTARNFSSGRPLFQHLAENVPITLLSFESANDVFGRTTNPHNRDYSPGGSTGGEAALLAYGGSRLGIGTDVAGSVRAPA